MSALDELLSPENFPPCDAEAGKARDELAALRQRVADLERAIRDIAFISTADGYLVDLLASVSTAAQSALSERGGDRG